MAGERDPRGTGRHPHKSSEEPYPHTKKEDRREGEHHARSEHEHGSGSHRGGAHAGEEHRGRSREHREHDTRGSQGNSDHAEEADLKRREYRDEKGEVHHHTKTYMEQHGGEKK
jgi:hypothetical protein